MAVSGSSPHTRGALGCRSSHTSRKRIIPAYAGSTDSKECPSIPIRDHPRIRGEHKPTPTWSRNRSGSSPHTRGALDETGPSPRSPRIIPAYAGSTGRRAVHSLGELGSSPHTRGARNLQIIVDPVQRIIPAYAGSTRARTRIPHLVQDHPRIRGEHRPVPEYCQVAEGSSPHTRGALLGAAQIHALLRIIPAYAGSTPGELWWLRSIPDHPRIRGEHVSRCGFCVVPGGSSPHTRGAPGNYLQYGNEPRIIPAYAGSTFLLIFSQACSRGSSPHTRGAPWPPTASIL